MTDESFRIDAPDGETSVGIVQRFLEHAGSPPSVTEREEDATMAARKHFLVEVVHPAAGHRLVTVVASLVVGRVGVDDPTEGEGLSDFLHEPLFELCPVSIHGVAEIEFSLHFVLLPGFTSLSVSLQMPVKSQVLGKSLSSRRTALRGEKDAEI